MRKTDAQGSQHKRPNPAVAAAAGAKAALHLLVTYSTMITCGLEWIVKAVSHCRLACLASTICVQDTKGDGFDAGSEAAIPCII